MPAYA
ncbi:hypothetical protein VTH06DRAFT_4654 [Thermothelomyces fergusii]